MGLTFHDFLHLSSTFPITKVILKYFFIIAFRFVDVTESSLHTLQVALRHFPMDDVMHVAEIRAAQLLTCPPEGLLRISGRGIYRYVQCSY